MSQPTFPQIDPPLTREGSLNEILSSIAMEELSLSHILNAEGEKLQYVLGTLPGLDEAAALEEVLQVNQSVKDTLSSVMEQQMALSAKLSAALKAPTAPGPAGPTGPTGPTGPAEGAAGPTGATGPNPTAAAAFAANTQGPDLNVPSYSGVAIPLPDGQVMSADITANPENTVFQVNKKGVYLLSYRVNLTKPAQVGTKLLIDGMARYTTTVIPAAPTASFENQYVYLMNAGQKLRLQLCAAPLAGISPKAQTVTLAGASLSIILLEER